MGERRRERSTPNSFWVFFVFLFFLFPFFCVLSIRKEGRQVVVKSEKELWSSSCIFVVLKGMLELSSGRERDGEDDEDANDEPTFDDLSWVLLLVP